MRNLRVLLAALLAALGVFTLVTPALGAAGRHGPASDLTIFRVDVSRYPSVGMVITVPGATRKLSSGAFTVTTGNQLARLKVRQLSSDDVEMVLAPDTGLARAAFRAQQVAVSGFLAALPLGEQTAVVNPATPGILPEGLSGDPAPAVATVANLASGMRSSAISRLETALSAFTTGPQVRRTVVLTVAGNQPLSRSLAAGIRALLAASGTSLYILDATPGGAPDYDALADGSGGFSARIRAPGDWNAAFARVTADLGEQYYLRFTDARPLPGLVHVSVRSPAGELRGVADLPAHNPIAPASLPPPAPVPVLPPLSWDTPFVMLAALLIVIGVSYGLAMLFASRREPARRVRHRSLPRMRRRALPRAERQVHEGPGDLFFVFMMPCLNEEKVILNSLQRLLSLPGDNFVVMVIDDGSDDGTPDVVSTVVGDRVWLLRRRPPEARQGKGEALNVAVRYLTGSGHLDGRDLNRVIVVVVDADGQLDPEAIEVVTPYFADPATGAVQIGVRINNRKQSRLARMQDMEFVIYTEVFQRGRRHLGSVGLGGNGQFMRLSAMLSLGSSPWTRSLTDDLDLGVRMIAAGWRNEYCADAAVHQQGVVELRRLIRQRSRWFQGHLQSWKLIPLVLRQVPRRARADLLYHLSSPAVLLIASLLSASFLLSIVNAMLDVTQGRDPLGWWVASTYALTFGPALAFSSVYWSREHRNGVGVLRTIMFAHMYVCYGMMWYASGWWAVGRILRGRTEWAKTDRVAESPVPAVAASGPVTAPQTIASSQTVAAGTASPGAVLMEGQPGSLPAPADRPVVQAAVPRRHRAKRRLIAIAAAVVAVTCAVSAVVAMEVGQHGGGPAQWRPVFSGYGTTSITGSGASLVVTLDPRRATSPDVSHAALVVSTRRYADFTATIRVRTVRQLRHGSAGNPKPWEVAWVVWHYTSEHRFYALTLEPTGWVLSKQDPSYPGGQRFLASGLAPKFPPGPAYTVGMVQVGDQITVSADGHMLTRFTDTHRPYLSGTAGFYCEDSQAVFDRVWIDELPAPPPAHIS